MNTDNFLIEESDIDQARSIVKFIDNPNIRSRALANALAALISEKYFSEVEIDIKTGLFNSSSFLEEYDISDIYVRDSYIDVRVYFDESEMYVPKIHFDKGLLPVAYMFIKLDEDVSGGLVTGFITPATVDTSVDKNGLYIVKEEDLVSFYDIEPELVSDYSVDIPDDFDTNLFLFLDNNLSDRESFIKLLLKSSELREKFIAAAKAKVVFKYVSLTGKNNSIQEENSELIEAEEQELLDESTNLELIEDVEPIEDLETSEEFGEVEEEIIPEIESLEMSATDEDSLMDLSDELSLIEQEVEEDTLVEVNGNLIEDSENIQIIEEQPEDSLLSDNEKEEEESETKEVSLSSFDVDSISMLKVGEIEPSIKIEDTITSDDKSEVLIEEPQDNSNQLELVDFDSEEEPDNIILDEVSDSNNNDENEISNNNNVDIIENQEIVEEEEENSFEFSTSTTPSLNSEEELTDENSDDTVDNNSLDDLESLLDQEEETSGKVIVDQNVENQEEIEELFGQEEYSDMESTFVDKKKKASPIVPILGLAVLGTLGYFGYTKYFNQEPVNNNVVEPVKTAPVKPKKVETKQAEVPMPVETVENVPAPKKTDEGNSVTIPAIENNLDASVLVSNLAVSWSVPETYVKNNSAKRYFYKIGKIIQLNLKTELLLLSKPPLTNEITVELEYNKNSDKFEVKNILKSSGENSIDEIISKTISKVLDMKLGVNMSAFANISGNPVLVIRL